MTLQIESTLFILLTAASLWTSGVLLHEKPKPALMKGKSSKTLSKGNPGRRERKCRKEAKRRSAVELAFKKRKTKREEKIRRRRETKRLLAQTYATSRKANQKLITDLKKAVDEVNRLKDKLRTLEPEIVLPKSSPVITSEQFFERLSHRGGLGSTVLGPLLSVAVRKSSHVSGAVVYDAKNPSCTVATFSSLAGWMKFRVMKWDRHDLPTRVKLWKLYVEEFGLISGWTFEFTDLLERAVKGVLEPRQWSIVKEAVTASMPTIQDLLSRSGGGVKSPESSARTKPEYVWGVGGVADKPIGEKLTSGPEVAGGGTVPIKPVMSDTPGEGPPVSTWSQGGTNRPYFGRGGPNRSDVHSVSAFAKTGLQTGKSVRSTDTGSPHLTSEATERKDKHSKVSKESRESPAIHVSDETQLKNVKLPEPETIIVPPFSDIAAGKQQAPETFMEPNPEDLILVLAPGDFFRETMAYSRWILMCRLFDGCKGKERDFMRVKGD